MSDLFLVRHGPTHAKGMVGWSDIPADLSDLARLARLNQHLPDDALIVSSDLDRARRTADAIQRDRRRLPHAHAFREIHFGAWEMRSFDDISAEDPNHIRAFYETPGEIAPPDGESWNALRARVDLGIDDLLSAHRPKPVIVVAHMGVILSLVQRALGVSAYQAFSHHIDPLSVTHLTTGPVWTANKINHHP